MIPVEASNDYGIISKPRASGDDPNPLSAFKRGML